MKPRRPYDVERRLKQCGHKITVGAEVSPEDYRMMLERANALGWSLSDVVRHALTEFLTPPRCES